jgi:dipeptidyl aminopeptidase/acylaminoacyl peptidase
LPRAVWLALALAVSLPVLTAGWTCLSSAAFLVEFLSDSRWRPLSRNTPRVSVRALPASADGRAIPTDLYTGSSFTGSPGLVLVHGLSADGKNEPRLRRAASLLARTGWAVAVPTVEGLTILRLRPDDSAAVVAAVRGLAQSGRRPVAILGISLGAGPALLAAADPAIASSVSAVMALGGYASAAELLRFTLTGAYRLDEVAGRRPVDERAVALFAAANAELMDAAGRRLVENRDPAALDALVSELPSRTRQLLTALSPETVVGRIRAPLFLIHGRDDPAVPFTESLRLERAARAAGRLVRTVIVGSVSHVEPDHRAGPRDLGRLWAGFYAFRVRSASVTWAGGDS